MPNSDEQHKLSLWRPKTHHVLSVTRRLQPAGRMHVGSFRQDAQGHWLTNLFILFRVLRQNRPQPGAV